MNTVKVKIPQALDDALARASARAHISKSEVVRRAVAAYLAPYDATTQQPSALARAGNLVGCFSGGPRDLASHPQYLEELGRP
jgi:metal-responsive CopG/Arc/MetJ family transcriptional regulator